MGGHWGDRGWGWKRVTGMMEEEGHWGGRDVTGMMGEDSHWIDGENGH